MTKHKHNYCECGRKILVLVPTRAKRKLRAPPDAHHDLCYKCWQELCAASDFHTTVEPNPQETT